MQTLVGIAASPGIVHGRTFVFAHQQLAYSAEPIDQSAIAHEIERFLAGRDRAAAQITTIHARAMETLGAHDAEVFEGHLELLTDEELEAEIRSAITDELCCAERAVEQVINANVADMEELEDEYMRERAADLRDIGKRLAYSIAGVALTEISAITTPVIVVAEDLTPSETAQMDRSKILGFVTAVGGPTSHVAIMARSLEIPAVVGCGNALETLTSDQPVILDGTNGSIVIAPDDNAMAAYRERASANAAEAQELAQLAARPAETTDGWRVELAANIGTDADVAAALTHGAEGIGLFRTEFLFMDKSAMPTEDEQFTAYRTVAEAMAGKPVVVRTIDVGGDKGLDYLDFPHELNPFLGWRAIRMCFDTPAILQTQLRALLRASAFGTIRIMFPMVISVEEVLRLRTMVEEEQNVLRSAGIAFDAEIQIGVMIETPAAAVIADRIARHVDFLSIGTNDLTQYTLAVDRGNERIAHLYRPFHPAIIELVRQVVAAGHRHNAWVGMCGEFAGNESATQLLMGLGLDELSMSAPSIPRVKRVIRTTTIAAARDLAERAATLDTADEIEALLGAAHSSHAWNLR